MEPSTPDLGQRLITLRDEYLRTKTFHAPEQASEKEIQLLRESHASRMAAMIEEQISIIAQLRRTGTGPARKGGKRAKNAPPDLSDLMD